MKLPRRRFLHLAAGVAALPALSRVARAQSYPTRPVRIVVGFAAGGAFDIAARTMGQWLSDRLGQPFIIENRPGGSTNIATEAVIRAPPDGYTLLLGGGTNAVNATLYEKLKFDFIKDTTPVAGIIRFPQRYRGDPIVSGEDHSRVDRPCQGQSGQDQLCVPWRRDHPASLRRTAQDAGQRQHCSRALPRSNARAGRPAGWKRANDICAAARIDRACQGGQTARPSGDHGGALRGSARSPGAREFVPGYEASAWNGVVAPR